jgi:putative FmdB family regulatory protein
LIQESLPKRSEVGKVIKARERDIPTYVYDCGEHEFEVIKSMAQASEPENCPQCQKEAQKIILPARISVSVCQFQAHYNWGLGKEVHKKADISEELRRIKGETGREIVEVGNDKLDSVKIQKKKYDIDLSEGGL